MQYNKKLIYFPTSQVCLYQNALPKFFFECLPKEVSRILFYIAYEENIFRKKIALSSTNVLFRFFFNPLRNFRVFPFASRSNCNFISWNVSKGLQLKSLDLIGIALI